MKNTANEFTVRKAGVLMGEFGHVSPRLVWQVLRVPIALVLVILEPAVGLLCGVLALLGILMALFFKFYGIPAEFPFLKMIAVSVCFALVPCAYGGLLRLITK
jgi:hypothetical protein